MHRVIPNERPPRATVRNGRNAPVRRCRNRRGFGPSVAKPEGFASCRSHTRGEGSQRAWRLSPYVADGCRLEGFCRRVDERTLCMEHTHRRGGDCKNPPLGLGNVSASKRHYGKGFETADCSNVARRLVFGTDRQEVSIFAGASVIACRDSECSAHTTKQVVGVCKAIRRVPNDPVVHGTKTRFCGNRKSIRQSGGRESPADIQASHGGARQLSQQNKFERESSSPRGMAPSERI